MFYWVGEFLMGFIGWGDPNRFIGCGISDLLR